MHSQILPHDTPQPLLTFTAEALCERVVTAQYSTQENMATAIVTLWIIITDAPDLILTDFMYCCVV